ncbi:hypothetical protein EDB19DRAFT_2039642 [Suillus lakei]|nr:hypothetical protein EDB19DRAFT_2039642 [Suillus lakei]
MHIDDSFSHMEAGDLTLYEKVLPGEIVGYVDSPLRQSMPMEVMDHQQLTEDRSLGSVELHVSDLARESPADSQYRYESTGARKVAEPIKIDGNTCQGHLHYRAEFVSALNLKHVHFDADENEIQKTAHKDLRSADRTGKSDPFAVFTLNGTKAFMCQTKKKALNPDWSKNFEVDPSREAADFSAEVFDWNRLEKSKSLGRGTINLRRFEQREQKGVACLVETPGPSVLLQLLTRRVWGVELFSSTNVN